MLVSSVATFDSEQPDALEQFFASLGDVGELSQWQDIDRLRVAKLKLGGAALKLMQTVVQGSVKTYQDFRRVLCEGFPARPHGTAISSCWSIYSRNGQNLLRDLPIECGVSMKKQYE